MKDPGLTIHSILIADDESLIRDSLEVAFIDEGYRVQLANTGRETLKKYERFEPDVLLLDMKLPDMNGIDVLKSIRREDSDAVVIIMTAYASVESAVNAMKLGAYDYLSKPFQTQNALSVVRFAMESKMLRREVRLYTRTNRQRYDLRNLIGHSSMWQQVLNTIKKIARAEVTTVLITGETGTGKELAARAIHHNSSRCEKPFIDINCSAIPPQLLESELFGYQKGAFTDAKRSKAGLIEEANGGTLFLDEIADLNVSLQAKLLRVLEERVLRRIGSTHNIPVDLRVIAATNQDLKQLIEDGKFREDLYYRLNIVHLELPPLRERGEDIVLLARHFIAQYNKAFRRDIQGMTAEVEEMFRQFPWKGNVRELKNFIERIVLLEECAVIQREHLPPEFCQALASVPANACGFPAGWKLSNGGFSLEQTLADMQRRFITQALQESGGNKTKAAKLLGVKRLALHHLIRKLQMQV